MTKKRLYRNMEDAKIAGICAGIGDYFDIDPVLVRLLFIIFLFTGGGLIAYIIGWLVIPRND
ncbi:MAG: PspC domain-containing protein [Bacteroidetes bacterium]|nr:PspC domain-containing protein [Bacteroidota bacterium]